VTFVARFTDCRHHRTGERPKALKVRWSCPERLACRDGQRCRAPGAVAERRSDGSEPGASDHASKEDVVALAPSESVDIYRNFRTFTGPYVTYRAKDRVGSNSTEQIVGGEDGWTVRLRGSGPHNTREPIQSGILL